MFSCTNALAQTIGALRKQDWHHPNTPDITQTIQALNKQSFPHIHPSFPRRRESIIMRHLAAKMDPRLRGDDEHGDVLVHQRACSNNRGTTQTGQASSKHSRHYPNDTGTEQTVVPAYQPVIPAEAGIHHHAAFGDPKWIPAFAGMTSTRDVLVHQRACSNNRGTTQTGLAPSKHSRHYPNDTGTEQTVVPAYQPVIPAKAGIHCHAAFRDPKWIPAFAGMTSTRDVLVHQRACSNNRGTTQTGLAPSKHSRHYPNDTGTEQTVVPAYQRSEHRRAGKQCKAAFRDPNWIPAFAWMTSTRDVRDNQRACSNNRG